MPEYGALITAPVCEDAHKADDRSRPTLALDPKLDVVEMAVKGEIVKTYRLMSADDAREFDKWLRANAVIATLFSAALLAMAVASPGPTPSAAMDASATIVQRTNHSAQNVRLRLTTHDDRIGLTSSAVRK